MTDLEVLASKLKEWRHDHPKGPYPKHFWEEIIRLAKQHHILTLAETLGISLNYLQQKLSKKSKQLTLTPVQVSSFAASVSIEFIDCHSRPMIVHFQANCEQLAHMILMLSDDTQ